MDWDTQITGQAVSPSEVLAGMVGNPVQFSQVPLSTQWSLYPFSPVLIPSDILSLIYEYKHSNHNFTNEDEIDQESI